MAHQFRTLLIILLGGLLPLGAAGQVVLKHGVLGNGGGAASDGTRAVATCAGQLATGIAAGPSHVCRQGVWYHTSQFCSGNEPPLGDVARVLRLEPARPNPSKYATTFRFELPHRGHAVLKIFDVSGRLVSTLVDDDLDAGIHAADLDAGDLPGGLYFCRLTASGSTRTSRLVLLR